MRTEAKPNRWPAIVAAAALHAGLFALALYAWPEENTPVTISSVPVQIVSDAPATAPDISPEAPAEAPAEIAEPVAEPVETPPPPPPLPDPTPPKPTPTPPKKLTPTPKPTPAKPTPPKPAPTKRRDAPAFDPSSIADSLSDAKARRPSKPTPKPAAKPGGAPQAGPISSTGQQSLNALTTRLGEIWNLQCVSETASARPRVLLKIAEDGTLVGKPRLREVSSDPALRAAGESALRAVQVGEDQKLYADLPPELYNRDLSITFRADQVCR